MKQHFDLRTWILLGLGAATLAVFAMLGQASFTSFDNIQSMLLQASVIGILSLAVSISLLSGGIDLSVNSTANLTAICASIVMAAAEPELGAALAIPLGVAAGLVASLACGALNGVLIARLQCPPILATLGTMMVIMGLGTVITQGETLFGLDGWAGIARFTFLGFPVAAVVMLCLAASLSLIMVYTLLGRRIGLIGANVKAARFSGIPIANVLIRTYLISGGLSGIAGLLSLSISNSVNVDFGSSYLLLAVLIAVLGGIDPAGGKGKIFGVVAAVGLLQLLSTGLNMLYQSSSSNFLKEFAWGLALLAVLALGRAKWIGDVKQLLKSERKAQ